MIGMASTEFTATDFQFVRKVDDITKESLDTYYDELGMYSETRFSLRQEFM